MRQFSNQSDCEFFRVDQSGALIQRMIFVKSLLGIGSMDFDKLFFVESEIFLTLIHFKLHIKLSTQWLDIAHLVRGVLIWRQKSRTKT